jgi:Glycosyl hydrolase catalytic core
MHTTGVQNGKRTGFALILVLLISLNARPQTAVQLTPPRGPVPEAYFGLHIHHLWQTTQWPSIPFGTWRLWDAHVLWTYLEPAPGKYDFSLLDKYVQIAQEHNVELILTLEGTPTWASSRPNEVPVHANGAKGAAGVAATPLTTSTWEDFLRTVGTRYKGKIRVYEIWNEPMAKPYFSGSPQEMAGLVKSASTVLKQIDPENRIISPPVSGDNDGIDWFDRFLSAGGGQFVDIYGFHFYVGGPPEKSLPKIERARALLRKYGQDSKPIWNTEAGWQISHLGPQVASDYVARAFLVSWPSGIGRYMFYSWDHPDMGIAPNGNASTPMVLAYATVEKWMVGSTVTRCVSTQNGLWVENLTMANGSQGKVVWSAAGSISLTKDNIGGATEYETLDGQKVQIRPNSPPQATESPILLLAGG